MIGNRVTAQLRLKRVIDLERSASPDFGETCFEQMPVRCILLLLKMERCWSG